MSLSSEKQMTDSTIVANKAVAIETVTKEVSTTLPEAISFKSPRVDDQIANGISDGSMVGEKVGLSTSTTSSSPALTFKLDGAKFAAATESIFGSGVSTSLNGLVAAPPMFNFGSKGASSTELPSVEASQSESGKPSLLFSFADNGGSSKETVAHAPTSNFGAKKNFDKDQQVPLASASCVDAESSGVKFGASSDSKLGNSIRYYLIDLGKHFVIVLCILLFSLFLEMFNSLNFLRMQCIGRFVQDGDDRYLRILSS